MAQNEDSKRRIVRETDSAGQLTATYVVSTTTVKSNAGSKEPAKTSARIDILPSAVSARDSASPSTDPTRSLTMGSIFRHRWTAFISYLHTLFLPTGYPHTVTEDYTPYQIYDSLQAFASSIAHLLSSRAVLQSLNLAENKSDVETATYATLLSIAQNTVANLSTILFAQYAAPRVSGEVKFYRFLADVVNDVAFVLDCLSPSLPTTYAFSIPTAFVPGFGLLPSLVNVRLPVRILALCSSSALRAVCGVAGGSSKAVLSSHFAKDDPSNIGELNAKDGSQETVVNLAGMWIGGVLVSKVNDVRATWMWMLTLLACHLWFNYCAVKSVRLRWLNRTRAAMVLGRVMSNQVEKGEPSSSRGITVDEVGRAESLLFGRGNALMLSEKSVPVGKCKIGASFPEFIHCINAEAGRVTGPLTKPGQDKAFEHIFDCLQHENYLIWFEMQTQKAVVVLKTQALPRDQLKSQYHGARLAQLCKIRGAGKCEMGALLSESLEWVNRTWEQFCSDLKNAGWNLDSTSLETPPGSRVYID